MANLPRVDPLPMAPSSCSLDDAQRQEQLARYRSAGRGAEVLERSARRIVLALEEDMPDALVDELIAVERGCCPFFELDWRADHRRLTVSVRGAEHEPALELIAAAVDPAPARRST
jgi:hypothetical protein